VNNYTENDTFEFGNMEENSTSNSNENNYENAFLFNTEVLNDDKVNVTSNVNNNDKTYTNTDEKQFDFNVFDTGFENEDIDIKENVEEIEDINPFVTADSKDIVEETKQEIVTSNIQTSDDSVLEQPKPEVEKQISVSQEVAEISDELPVEVESLEDRNNSFDKKTEELSKEINSSTQKIQMSDEDLTSLTTFKEDRVETTDIKSLFDRVGVNVKEASDVFKRNTEMKEKLDSRFEELKKLQLEVARKKDEQYAEINSYKEEVLNKLTEKKEEIERRLNKLKDFQASLEQEKEEFEQYRKKEKEEIERVQKEVQEAYDSRRDELNHIEDVLRRQKDLLDEERSQLSLDKIQYESDKNELANNLLKFNEIVDSFTNGIDKLDKE